MENLEINQLLATAFNNKKVFVTGHTGFKGAWLCCWLKQLGAEVYGYSLAPEYDNGLYTFLPSTYFAANTIADIRNVSLLETQMQACKPDYLFHLAAQPLVRKSYKYPTETFDINVVGTSSVLQTAASLSNPCTIIVITTDKVYENKEQHIFYKETDTLGGYDPYSASKACAELVVSSFRNSFFHPKDDHKHKKQLFSVRAGNVIGGGDWSQDRIIPDIVRFIQNNQPIPIRNPKAVRPWQHVLEPICGYLQLAALVGTQNVTKTIAGAYNFGPLPSDHLTVEDIVNTAIKVFDKGTWLDISNANQPHEAGLLQLDIQKAIQELNWKPKLSAQKAIEWTIDWYKQPAEQKLSFTLQQIKDYSSL